MTYHLTLGVYPNGHYISNVVREKDLEDHIQYNKTYRPGRLLYVDGQRVYDGMVKDCAKYDKVAEAFYARYDIDMSRPTLPYA